MRMLLTNDDGIQAPGLLALAQALAPLGEVIVAAPDHNCSANSHHLTMQEDIPVVRAKVPGAAVAWAVGGTPVDCVQLARACLLEGPVDLVVSGINRGGNFSTDCLYSGTVAAALEASVFGLPGLAVSLDDYSHTADYTAAAAVGARMAAAMLQDGRRLALNVNVPARPLEKLRGMCWTLMDRRMRYPKDTYTATPGPLPGQTLYRFVPAGFDRQNASADVRCVQEGYVSVTPLTWVMSDAAGLVTLAEDFPLPVFTSVDTQAAAAGCGT